MKKLSFTFIVLAITFSSYGGTIDIVISGLNGQPITPVKEIYISPTDVISMDIIYTPTLTGCTLFCLSVDMYIDGRCPGTFDISTPTWPPGIWDMTPPMTGTRQNQGCNVSIWTSAAGAGSGSGVVVDHILFHCESYGTAVIKLRENPESPPGGTLEYCGDLVPIDSYGTGVVIQMGVHATACWQCPTQPYGDATGPTAGSCPDGKVNIYDLTAVRKAYGTNSDTSPHGKGLGQYNCCADFCGMSNSPPDGIVNIYDLVRLRKYYGQTVGSPCSECGCD